MHLYDTLARICPSYKTLARPSLPLSQDMRMGQVYQPAQLDDWAMVYLLLLSGAEQRSPVNALLQNWYSGLLHHKDYDVDVQGSGVIEVLTAAASASTQELRAHPPQLLATKIEAMPPSLQWGASFALCAVMVDKEVRNASTSLEHTYAVLSSDSAACTASAWLTAATAINNLERLDTTAAVVELAVTTVASDIAAAQHRQERAADI
jgi:hypothetical protein